MSTMLTGQELYCFLQQQKLTRPIEDCWRSIKEALIVYLDCWKPGYKTRCVESECDEIGLIVTLVDEKRGTDRVRPLFDLVYHSKDDTLEICWLEDDDFQSHCYPINWSK